jgi:hypothetical protein
LVDGLVDWAVRRGMGEMEKVKQPQTRADTQRRPP